MIYQGFFHLLKQTFHRNGKFWSTLLKFFLQLTEACFLHYFYSIYRQLLYSVICRPSLWGGPCPRLEPEMGCLEAGTQTTRPRNLNKKNLQKFGPRFFYEGSALRSRFYGGGGDSNNTLFQPGLTCGSPCLWWGSVVGVSPPPAPACWSPPPVLPVGSPPPRDWLSQLGPARLLAAAVVVAAGADDGGGGVAAAAAVQPPCA